MFARQLAVMKGQAWNVVETLKTPDHGPLELTRRARVCVWDDLVDVPVAVRLREPSEEMQRRHAAEASARADIQEEEEREEVHEDQEEMDISAAHAATASPSPFHDIDNRLDLLTPHHDLPSHDPARTRSRDNRFNISRQPSATDTTVDAAGAAALSPASVQAMTVRTAPRADGPASHSRGSRPDGGVRGWSMRLSLDEQRQRRVQRRQSGRGSGDEGGEGVEQGRRRRRRFSLRGGSPSGAWAEEEEEAEMDLGFAAAEDMEGSRKRVIVERLEMVKSKNPVFTWC